jgi:hypothetical protein
MVYSTPEEMSSWQMRSTPSISMGRPADTITSVRATITSLSGSYALTYPIGFLLWGLIIGLFQTTVLAHKNTRAWAWVPACGVAMLSMGYFTLAMPMFLPPIVGGGYVWSTYSGTITMDLPSSRSIERTERGGSLRELAWLGTRSLLSNLKK